MKERWRNKEYKEKMLSILEGKRMKGKKHSKETKEKMSITAKKVGTGKWWKGKKWKESSKELLRKKRKGERNPNWKGDFVGYLGLHSWVRKNYGKPNKCENTNCLYPRKSKMGYIMKKPARHDWANLGIYNRERKNWAMLCKSCHMFLDRGNKNNFVLL